MSQAVSDSLVQSSHHLHQSPHAFRAEVLNQYAGQRRTGKHHFSGINPEIPGGLELGILLIGLHVRSASVALARATR